MTWANRITIFRILLIPVFVGLLLYYHESAKLGAPDERLRLGAAVVFLVAALSDALDGYLARYCNQRSKLGAVLDPIADKLLLLAALIMLSIVHFGESPGLPLWFPILIISRDALLLIGFVLLNLITRHIDVKPHWIGKVATFLQLLAIGMVLVKMDGVLPVCIAGGVCVVITLFIYTRVAVRHFVLSGYAQANSINK